MPDPDPPLPQPQPASWFGDRPPLLGDFEIQDLIGHGAMGAVFKARQRSMDRIVAVKILRPRLARDPEYVQRFLEEARAAARLNHPNIVLAIDVGESSGLYYFAMERVEGHTAKLLLRAGAFDEARCLEIGRQLALALDYAWTQEHLVHRDVKPANIIITPKGTVKLADLGLAHDPNMARDDLKTSNGGIVGTPLYIAPEQIRRLKDLDVRCDLYALGATLFHMVTGRAPYDGPDSKTVMAKHLGSPIPDPREVRPELSEGFAAIITRLLAKDRDDRYPDAKALVADIDSLLAPPPHHDAPTTDLRPVSRRLRRHRRQALFRRAVTAGLVLAVLVSGGLALWALSRKPTPAARGPAAATPAVKAQVAPTPAVKAYDAALSYVDSHPTDYLACLARLHAVEDAYPDAEQARYAKERRVQLEQQLGKEARRAIDDIARRAKRLADKKRYLEALALFDTFPKHLATEGWAQKLAAERAALERDARRRFDVSLAAADALADTGHLNEAIEAYQQLLASAPPAWRQAVADRASTIRKQQQAANAQAEAARQAFAYTRFRDRLPTLYYERRYGDAVQLLRSILNDVAPDKKDELKRELDAAEHLVDFWLAVQAGVTECIGKPVQVRSRSGTLQAFRDGELQLKPELGPVAAEKLAALPTEDIIRFAERILPAEQVPLATANFLVAEGAVEPATDVLAKLAAAGTDVAHLRARLKVLARSDPLKLARMQLDEAHSDLAKGHANKASGTLEEMLKTLRGLPAPPQALIAEADLLLRNATRAPLTYAETAKAATLRVACAGVYGLYLNGKLFAEGLYRRGQFDTYSLKVSPNDLLAVKVESAAAHPGFYAFLSVDGGQHAVATDPTWRWCEEAPDGWNTSAKPEGLWQPATPVYSPHARPGYADAGQDLDGYWIWGRGRHVYFRKQLRLSQPPADLAAEEETRQKRLTAKYGQPARATIEVACRNAYRLYHNGRLVGCAASYAPRGAVYPLTLRHGDVLGVHTYDLPDEAGWLDAIVRVEGRATPIRTDRSWVYTTHPPADTWNGRGHPVGIWRVPYFYDADTFRIRADARSAYFRKTIDLGRPGNGRAPLAHLRHGRVRVSGTKAEVTYDFSSPEQLADWRGDHWAWRKGKVGCTGGAFSTGPYNMHEIQVETEVAIGGRLSIVLSGPTDRRGVEGDTYELRFTDTRRGSVYLRSRGGSLAHAQLTPSKAPTRHIVLRKVGNAFVVWVDKRRIISAKDEEPIPPDRLWQVSFITLDGTTTVIHGARITGQPDWEAIRDGLARRKDRPAPDAARAPLGPPREGPAPPRPEAPERPPVPPREEPVKQEG
ncbi:protein kinase [bacterium]|nr:protein kinase [bacterium]